MHYWVWDNGWHMIWMPAIMLLGVGLAVLLFWFLIRTAGGGISANATPPLESPEEILKRRYARGEIDRRRFEEMMKDITK